MAMVRALLSSSAISSARVSGIAAPPWSDNASVGGGIQRFEHFDGEPCEGLRYRSVAGGGRSARVRFRAKRRGQRQPTEEGHPELCCRRFRAAASERVGGLAAVRA